MSTVFEQSVINGMVLKNRFVHSAVYNGMAEKDGSVSQKVIDLVAKPARGGVGLIVTGASYVRNDGHAYVGQGGIHDDALLPGLRGMTQAVHDAGSKVIAQLYHGGLLCDPKFAGPELLGPSMMNTDQGPQGKEMTIEQIREMVVAFSAAAVRAKQAGFDGVEIHAAHGFLLSQYLSPFFNHRTDSYGGSIENRARLLIEMVQAIKEAVGAAYPLLVKINADDYLPGGFSTAEMVQVAKLLEKAGVDAIELSGGTVLGLLTGTPDTSFARTERKGLYYEEAAKRYQESVSVPLILDGGIRSLQESSRLVEQGITEYVGMGRPLVREPDMIQRWQSGDTEESGCLSDNDCLFQGLMGNGVHCTHLDA
jgi:2,4-dienoyl-CoA reductase-like NADH-dependent reductase (Old Yellow Enzyme family)